jgi:2-keto-4-pentenoate hydratase/2-oxohepta-3-ene-1,7-dioic acid hydratase in catechol pathway
MKIIRFVDEKGNFCLGRPEGTEWPPAAARLVEGDVFTEFRVGKKLAVVKRLLAPLLPREIWAGGLNYRGHAAETGIELPELPVFFLKAVSSVIGLEETILLPAAGPAEVDYEGELAVVIGREGKNIHEARAGDYIFGYTVANDVSARDWQNRLQKKQWARGKSFDTFCPLGPCLVTADELGDPQALRLTTLLNGRIVQQADTSDMIFSVFRLVAEISRSTTLLPGTLILTGTPAGVGFTRQPPLFLRPGDRVAVTVDKIGTLSNPVALE